MRSSQSRMKKLLIVVKSLALKDKVTKGQTSNDSVCQNGSDEDVDEDEDEEFNSIVRNIWKLFKKGNRFKKQNHFGDGGDRSDRGHGDRIKGVGSSRRERSCYGCGSKNHFVDDCPRAKVKKEFVGGAWSSNEDGDQIEKDTTCLMAIDSDRQRVPSYTKKETYTNAKPENKKLIDAETEVVHMILNGIRNDIYSTVDACPNAKEMNKDKEIVKPTSLLSKATSEKDSDEEQAQRDKHTQKSIHLSAEQNKWLQDTDEEPDEQELEAHCIQHSEQPEYINDTYVVEKADSDVILDSSDMCDNEGKADQY
ncbi:putative reverse transcriptase domain-containing protein [Tanacetum coccineum]